MIVDSGWRVSLQIVIGYLENVSHTIYMHCPKFQRRKFCQQTTTPRKEEIYRKIRRNRRYRALYSLSVSTVNTISLLKEKAHNKHTSRFSFSAMLRQKALTEPNFVKQQQYSSRQDVTTKIPIISSLSLIYNIRFSRLLSSNTECDSGWVSHGWCIWRPMHTFPLANIQWYTNQQMQ